MSSLRRGVLAIAIVLPLVGCTATVEPVPGPSGVVLPSSPAGTLVVDWTIQLLTDPAYCDLARASFIEVHVVAASGADAGTYEQACSAFSTSIALAPGSYSATATLADGARQPLTTAVAIAPFTILGNDVLHVPIDFPTNSFL